LPWCPLPKASLQYPMVSCSQGSFIGSFQRWLLQCTASLLFESVSSSEGFCIVSNGVLFARPLYIGTYSVQLFLLYATSFLFLKESPSEVFSDGVLFWRPLQSLQYRHPSWLHWRPLLEASLSLYSTVACSEGLF
jgi:hypothetical protein